MEKNKSSMRKIVPKIGTIFLRKSESFLKNFILFKKTWLYTKKWQKRKFLR